MADDRKTRRLRLLVERPERCTFWGFPYIVTPRLIAHEFGDALIAVSPMASRPDYFVARVPLGVDVRDALTPRHHSLIEEIMLAAEDEYGCFNDDELTDDERVFPIVDWGIGVSWGKPIAARDWKPSPPLTRRMIAEHLRPPKRQRA